MSTSLRGMYWTAGYFASRSVSASRESAMMRPAMDTTTRDGLRSTLIGWSGPGTLVGLAVMASDSLNGTGTYYQVDGYLDPLHPAPDRDVAADVAGAAARCGGLSVDADRGLAASRTADHPGFYRPARGQCGSDGDLGGRTARAPACADFRYHGIVLDQCAGQFLHHDPVRSEPKHRCRGPGCPGRNQRGCR